MRPTDLLWASIVKDTVRQVYPLNLMISMASDPARNSNCYLLLDLLKGYETRAKNRLSLVSGRKGKKSTPIFILKPDTSPVGDRIQAPGTLMSDIADKDRSCGRLHN